MMSTVRTLAKLTIASTVLYCSIADSATAVVSSYYGATVRTSPYGRSLGRVRPGSRISIIGIVGSSYKIRLYGGYVGYVSRYSVRYAAGRHTYYANNRRSPTRYRPRGESGRDCNDRPRTIYDIAGATRDVASSGRLRGFPSNALGTPIQPVITRAVNRCAPGCGIVNDGVWGDKRHQAKKSCHNSGNAIDIVAFTCGDKKMSAGSPGFRQIWHCMEKIDEIYTIFDRDDHEDHMHVSLRSCEVGKVGKVRGRGR